MSFSTRHTEDEIEAFIHRYRYYTGSGSKILMKILGIFSLTLGGMMLFTFWLTGLLETSSSFVFYLLPGIIIFMGIFLLLGSNRRSKPVKNNLSKKEIYRVILTQGKIIDAKIVDRVANFYVRVAGFPQTTYYLDVSGDKVKIKSNLAALINFYQNKDTMKVYYHTEFPEIIIPYELVNNFKQANEEQYTLYRKAAFF